MPYRLSWLLIAIFYGGSLYAGGHMSLTLDNYHPASNNFRPYFFERDPYTGKSIKASHHKIWLLVTKFLKNQKRYF
jgi:hypothetical protein